ncbi:MAG: phosphoglycerate dehydrogenase [Candidatus Omnitrophica bacterium]|nr:phosphoglycerate dehydrogenase [Candidatus Omnitrophota bacterium]
MTKAKKIFISTSSFGEFSDEPIKLIEEAGLEYGLNPYGRKMTSDELSQLAFDVDGLIAGTETLDGKMLNKFLKLKVISRCGAGIDNVDIDYTQQKGIRVYNTPDAPTLAVAELTVGLIVDMLRGISELNSQVHQGQWKKKMGSLLFKKRVGIIGYGRIGRKVAELLKAFGCELKFYDKYFVDKIENVERVELDELLAWSDIITIHVSESQELITPEKLRLMRKGTWIVNTCRGGVVNEQALFIALKEKHLAGAALDVFLQEPYDGNLKELDNVILTPHIGSYAKESRVYMETQAVENLLDAFK